MRTGPFAKPRCGSRDMTNCAGRSDSPACPISRRCNGSCSVWTIQSSTTWLARRCVGCSAVAAKAGNEPAWAWTPRVWRKERVHFFVRRLHHHLQKPLPWRYGLKWVVVQDLDQQFLLSQSAHRGPWNDCANLTAVVETASRQTRIGLVLADAEFDSESNHTHPQQELGAHSVIPARRGKKTWRVHGVRGDEAGVSTSVVSATRSDRE
jgi:hypothetical protein